MAAGTLSQGKLPKRHLGPRMKREARGQPKLLAPVRLPWLRTPSDAARSERNESV